MTPSRHRFLLSPPAPHRITTTSMPYIRYERIGNPNLRIFRLRLPHHLMVRLDGIITHSERYVQRLPDGWKTELYSLTKQDLALRDVPGMDQHIRPISDYITQSIQALYGCRKVVIDKNQPHILKYSVKSGHTGGKRLCRVSLSPNKRNESRLILLQTNLEILLFFVVVFFWFVRV